MKSSIPKLHSIKMKNHSNVEWLEIPTTHDIDPQTVLLSALNTRLKEVVILGFDQEGEEFFASNIADGADVLWHLERAKKKLLEIPDRS